VLRGSGKGVRPARAVGRNLNVPLHMASIGSKLRCVSKTEI
jgi:hypothetical protein